MRESKPDYLATEYCTPIRMASYGYQVKEVMTQKPQTLLEVGIGNKVVANILKSAKIEVTTLDIDYMVKPDIVGSVLDLPFKASSFHGVLCCEVLEHLPFDKFMQSMREIWRVTSAFAILSLPDTRPYYRIALDLPKVHIKTIKEILWKPREQKFDGQHYWEIGKRGFLLPAILTQIQKAGFRCLKHYGIWEWPYHRFFVLKKEIAPNQRAFSDNKIYSYHKI